MSWVTAGSSNLAYSYCSPFSVAGIAPVGQNLDMRLNELLPDILGRTEESNPPVFWSLTGEIYPAMVDGLFEAALLTGVVQSSNVQITLSPETTYFSLQNNTEIGIPAGVIAALRLRAPYSIRKTSLKALDDYQPNWQNAEPSIQLQAWFPLGVSAFGIYPQLSVESTVVMDFLVSPINQTRPYDGSEVIPLQDEFADLISMYAAAMLRMKEAGVDAEEADTVFQSFMGRMKQLSAFQTRIDSLTYSPASGAGIRVNPREVV